MLRKLRETEVREYSRSYIRGRKCPNCEGKENIRVGWLRDDKLVIGPLSNQNVRCLWCGWEGVMRQLKLSKGVE